MLEPGDTTTRTSNPQQTNTNRYKFQGTPEPLREAQALVPSWAGNDAAYLPAPAHQKLLRELMNRFPYRLDTNFAKMDRIAHADIEAFKERVYATEFHGHTIGAWKRLLAHGDEDAIRRGLEIQFNIRDEGRPVVK